MSTLHRVKASHEISKKIGMKQRRLARPLHKVRPLHQGLALCEALVGNFNLDIYLIFKGPKGCSMFPTIE
jgi:hypothetical protein